MIPKIIHYCWFGNNPLPELAQKCIQSWKQYCPDYELMLWNEENFDINECAYVKEAYENKKWAFVTDYVRLKVLYEYGGIYMDTDVEVIKPLDSLLNYVAVSGFETEQFVPTGLIAAEKDSSIICELLNSYDGDHFVKKDGTLDLTTNVVRITNYFIIRGLVLNNTKQTIDNFTFLPKDFLCPKDFITKELELTQNTLTIHHFDGSWLSDEDRYCANLNRQFINYLPKTCAEYLARAIAILKYCGISALYQRMIKFMRNRK